MKRTRGWKIFFIVFLGLLITYSSTTTVSGGIWFSSSGNINALQYNYNATQLTNMFPVDHIQFLISVPELNFIYYSLYNSTSQNNEIFRARPDGSNPQYVTTTNSLHDDPNGRKGVVKFGIDAENGYLYYTSGTSLYQSLLTGVNPTELANYSPHIPTSVTFNSNQKTIGVLVCTYSNPAKYVVNLYNETSSLLNSLNIQALIADFSINSGIVAWTYEEFIVFEGLGSYSGKELSFASSLNAPIDYDWNNGVLYWGNGSEIVAVNVTVHTYDFIISTSISYSSLGYLSVEESSCPNDCECKGECVVQSGSSHGECECIDNYFSSDCSVYCKCSNGECNSEGICICNEGFFGTNCTIPCSSAQNCSNNGYCISVGEGAGCFCDDGYLGVNCSVKELPIIHFSGGIISQPYGNFVVNASIFNWNFTQTSMIFPIPDPNYLVVDPNSNYIYFSLYNQNFKLTQLFRAYYDGSEMEFIANLTLTSGDIVIVQKFSFDINYEYLYFAASNAIYRYSLENNTVELFYTWMNGNSINSVAIDAASNNIWYSTWSEVLCITDDKVDCTTTRVSFTNIYDFVVYNSTVTLIQNLNKLVFIDANGTNNITNMGAASYSCNCLTIDPTLQLIYYSNNKEILTLTISPTFKSIQVTNSTYYLPYSNIPNNNQGVSFLSYTPSSCPMDCGANGDCMMTSLTEGECVCNENYYTSDCSVYCIDSTTCSNKGVCTDQGECDCDDGYYSYNCGCNPEISCSGSGNCTASGSCSCFEYSSGPNCTPIIPNPVVPSSFFCTSYFRSGKENTSTRIDMSISEPSQERRFDQFNADGDIDRSIIQNFISGIQYNITYNPEECFTEYLKPISFSSFVVPEGARLTFFNGTAGSCVKNAVEVWNTSIVQYTYVQVCDSSAPSGLYSLPYQIYWIEENNFLDFMLDSFSFSVPSSNYTLPTFC